MLQRRAWHLSRGNSLRCRGWYWRSVNLYLISLLFILKYPLILSQRRNNRTQPFVWLIITLTVLMYCERWSKRFLWTVYAIYYRKYMVLRTKISTRFEFLFLSFYMLKQCLYMLFSQASIDDDTDDNGSECVICMCDTRDTLILPCRHLCLCNSCADSLRYQANNCPICRAPFRALLQIKAVQKTLPGVTNGLAPQSPQDVCFLLWVRKSQFSY